MTRYSILRSSLFRLGLFVFFRAPRLGKQLQRDLLLVQDRSIRQPRANLYFGVVSAAMQVLRLRPRIRCLVVTQIGRFGNSYIQIANALTLARQIGIETVVAEGVPWLSSGLLSKLNVHLRSGTTSHRFSAFRGPVLVGKFFYSQEFPGFLGEKIPSDVSQDLFSASTLKPEDPPLGNDTLVVHIRGGDVFTSKPPRHYGQPPFAFYQRIIESRNWAEVVIVHEDGANPVLHKLGKYLDDEGLPYWLSSGDLQSDLKVLFRARNLVCGNGSFTRAVVDMSPNLRTYFRLDGTYPIPSSNLNATEVTIYDLDETFKREILQGNWSNSQRQLQLMLDYPVKSLSEYHSRA